ncbi:MAG: acyl-CoA desaturase [Ignavibacteria bacterium]|nr:acyl-CoA desaturase [Ignavibacteria bacterium]
MEIIIFFTAHWYISLFSQSFLQHRYASHRAFTMNRFWERFFYIFAYITQGSSYLSARAYGIMHRMHHAYTDTEKDPHSPKYFSNVFSLMWHTKTVYADIMDDRMEVEERFTRNLPDWASLDKWGQSLTNRLIFASMYTGFYVIYADYWWMYALIPVHILMGPVHGSIINWFAHKYGSVNFKLNNTSRNFIPLDVLMLGENYHNNHHKYPSSANFGVKWYEIDPLFYGMKVLSFLRIIKFRNQGKRIETEY